MVHCVVSAVLMTGAWDAACAQTQTEAFKDGKTFGAGLATGATQSVNAANGAATVPSYTNTAPEAVFYGAGKGLVGSAGMSKQGACTTSTAPTAYLQQECDVVNYLTQMPAMRTVYPMSATDPLIANSDPVIQSPGAPGGASSAQVCRTVSQNNPGEYITETCTTARKTDFPSCINTLDVTVTWQYSCPANTISGPKPDANDLSVPQRNTCAVADPYYVASCDAALDVLSITGPGTGICTDPITLVQTPATRTLFYNNYTVTAKAVPEVTDAWDDRCGDFAERARLTHMPYPDCVEPAAQLCVQGPETRVINGLAVSRSCWQWQRNFACLNPGFDASCGPRSSALCAHTGDTCLQFTIDGRCAVTSESYSCEKTAPSVTTHQVCEPASFCQTGGAQCFSTERQPDGDFAKAAVAMETTRQAGVYGFNGTDLELFKGYGESCSIKVLGGAVIKSCCGAGSGGSAFSNHQLLGAAMSVAGSAARSGAVVGSKYVYDALYQTVDSDIVNKGISAMNSWASGLGSGTFTHKSVI